MLKKITWMVIGLALSVGFISFRSKYYSSQPPPDHSGTPGGGLCSDCHGNLNSGGGSIVVNGLPATFKAGQTYPFSVTITHGAANRTRWGFEINARNAGNNGIGTFKSTNPNATTNGGPSEIAHNSAVVTAATNSYTYSGLSWTAPSTIAAGDNAVTFYMAGNAANNNGSTSGDFIYASTRLVTLPVNFKALDYKVIDDYKVQVNWTTANENNSKEFIIEKSDDNSRFYEAGRVSAAGSSSAEKSYSFTDSRPSFFNKAIYYRLKQVDMDGQFKYSKVFQVTLKGKSMYVFSISPNPAVDHITAGITSDLTAKVEARIVSAAGNTTVRQILQLQKGRSTYRVSIPALQHGVYYFMLESKDYSQTIPFIVL
jgi:hypothetical protein